jgi:hypothetical protein
MNAEPRYLPAMALILNQLDSKNTVEALIIVPLGLFKANPLPSCIICGDKSVI